MFYHELLGVGMSVRARTHQGGVGLLPELVLRVDVVSRGKSATSAELGASSRCTILMYTSITLLA